MEKVAWKTGVNGRIILKFILKKQIGGWGGWINFTKDTDQ